MNNDISLSLGGLFIKDRLWFYANGRYLRIDKETEFVPCNLPYDPPTLVTYDPWPKWYHEEKMGFLKLTAQVTSKLRITGMANYTKLFRPIDADPAARVALAATTQLDENSFAGTGVFSYVINPNALLELRLGYVHRYTLQPFQEDAIRADKIWLENAQPRPGVSGLAYSINTPGYNSSWNKDMLNLKADFTLYKDSLLGGNHKFKTGIELGRDSNAWNWWRENNSYWYWNQNSPYYYGYTTANDVVTYGLPHSAVGVGFGFMVFYICGPKEGDNPVNDIGNRFSIYIQDGANFKKRLTFNFGLRFDASRLDKVNIKIGQSGNPLALYLGENYVKPYTLLHYPETFPEGLNPYLEATAPDWKKVMTWSKISPRIAVTYDLFGDGKTALKASYSRYVDYMMLRFALAVSPFDPGWSWWFYWFDLDMDKVVEQTDYFWVYPWDFRKQSLNFVKKIIDPNINAPYTDEIIFGVQRELFKNFSIGIDFRYKERYDILEKVYWDPDTGRFWYNLNYPEAREYWIPFKTIVPGTGNYPDWEVTVYYRRKDAPAFFYRGAIIPELKMKYKGLTLSFNKQMSGKWQLSGSVVISKAYGNLGGTFSESEGWTSIANDPNWWVNRWGRQSEDRPLQIKLGGTYLFPYGI